jgi:serine/threonine protein kinase
MGRNLGRYRVLSVLGQGGMGVVWRGHDDTLRRDVALKILTQHRKKKDASGGLNVELFMQEARAVAKLQHPSVVSIFEVAEDSGQVFLALELMEGGTLKEYVERQGAVPARSLFEMMIGPAKALSLAHKRGIVHRDVKPGNLMFDDHGHLKLMDFGLADVANEAASAKIRGKAVGSLGWIAPETAKGQGTTAASDIYAFGLVMMYALTGRPWIHADSRSKLISLHQKPPVLDLSPILGLTPLAREILQKCMAVNPADRFASADALVEALQRCASDDPEHKLRIRRSSVITAAAMLLVGSVLGVGAALYYFSKLDQQANEVSQPVARQLAPQSNNTKEPKAAPPGVALGDE